jgi:spoIIIJ-associated protein
MAERDLDRYLEGIGIDIDGEQEARRPLGDAIAPDEGRDDAGADGAGLDDAGLDVGVDPDDADEVVLLDDDGLPVGEDASDAWGDDIDFERAMAGVGLGGVVPDDLAADQRAETFLVQLLLYLDPTYAVDVTIDHDGSVHADVHGGDAGRLIGKGGRTLAALEFLTNAVVNKVEGETPVRVNVDVGGYKRRRDERLRIVAQRAAARVRKSGLAVELEPMSAAERRVVHMELADDPAVESESTGEGRDRRVVVYPVGDGA